MAVIDEWEWCLMSGLQDGGIKEGIPTGGCRRDVLVGCRGEGSGREYLAYFRPTWRRELMPLRTGQDKSDRVYRDLTRLFVLIRDDFAYQGVVPVYMEGDPELERYKALRSEGLPG